MVLRTLHVTTIDLTAHCFLRTTFDLLRSQGHQVALACDFQRFGDELALHTDRLFQVKIPRQIQAVEDLYALFQLVQIIRTYKPHILHSHTSKAGFLARLAGYLNRVPLVIHSIYELPQNSTHSRIKQCFYWSLEKIAALWCQHLITISRINLEQILREKICPAHKLTFIPCGLPLQNYQNLAPSLPPWNLPQDAVIMGMAARLEPAKGHSDLLQAMAQLVPHNPHLHLVLMGTGYLKPQLEKLRDDLGLTDRVHFIGWVEDLISVLTHLDLFVLSSHYEGLGVVLLEALALGIPAISTRVGGTQDIIDDEITGLFAPSHNPVGLAQTIQRLLDNPALAARLAQAGKEKVYRHYSAQDTDQKIIDLYKQLYRQIACKDH